MASRRSKRHKNQCEYKAKQLEIAREFCLEYGDPGGFDVRFIDDDIGEGVFTTKSFLNGDFLLEYHGDLIKDYQRAIRLESQYAERDLGCFMYYFKYKGKNLCIDATNDIFREGRKINDAPKGNVLNNCDPKIVVVDEIPHICIFATRDITEGEELRFDYGDSNLPWRKKPKEKPDGAGTDQCGPGEIAKRGHCEADDLTQSGTDKCGPGELANTGHYGGDDRTQSGMQHVKMLNADNDTNDTDQRGPGELANRGHCRVEDRTQSGNQHIEMLTSDNDTNDTDQRGPGELDNRGHCRVDDITQSGNQHFEMLTPDNDTNDTDQRGPGELDNRGHCRVDDRTQFGNQHFEMLTPDNDTNDTDQRGPGELANRGHCRVEDRTQSGNQHFEMLTPDNDINDTDQRGPGELANRGHCRVDDRTQSGNQHFEMLTPDNDTYDTDQRGPGELANRGHCRVDDRTQSGNQHFEMLTPDDDINDTDQRGPGELANRELCRVDDRTQSGNQHIEMLTSDNDTNDTDQRGPGELANRGHCRVDDRTQSGNQHFEMLTPDNDTNDTDQRGPGELDNREHCRVDDRTQSGNQHFEMLTPDNDTNDTDQRGPGELANRELCRVDDRTQSGNQHIEMLTSDNDTYDTDQRGPGELDNRGHCRVDDITQSGNQHFEMLTPDNDINDTDQRGPGELANRGHCRVDDRTQSGNQHFEMLTPDNDTYDTDQRGPGELANRGHCRVDDRTQSGNQHFEMLTPDDDINDTDQRGPGELANRELCRVEDRTQSGNQHIEMLTSDNDTNDTDQRGPGELDNRGHCRVDDRTQSGNQHFEMLTPDNDTNDTDQRGPGELDNREHCRVDDRTQSGNQHFEMLTPDNDTNDTDQRGPGELANRELCRVDDRTQSGNQHIEMLTSDNDTYDTDQRGPGELANRGHCRVDDRTQSGNQHFEMLTPDNDTNDTDQRGPGELANRGHCRVDDRTQSGNQHFEMLTSDNDTNDIDLCSSGSEWFVEDGSASSDSSDSCEYLSDDKNVVLNPNNTNKPGTDSLRQHDAAASPGPSTSNKRHQTESNDQYPHARLLCDDEKIKCERNRSIYIKKPAPSTKSKTGRSYDIVHSCYFCAKLLTNIQKHIENQHKNKVEVKDILELKNQKENIFDPETKRRLQKTISNKQTMLKNKGDHKHNMLVRKHKRGELLLSRRRKGEFNSEAYGACPECYEWIVLKDNYGQHRETCPAKNSTSCKEALIQNMALQGKIASTASKQLRDEVFPIMHNDSLTHTAMEDQLIVALGEIHFMSSIGNRLKRKNYASYRMRLAARLLHLLREEIDDHVASMQKCLNVEYFDVIAKCSILACGKNSDSELKHPSVAIKLGFDLAKMVSAKIGYAAKQRKEPEYKDAKRFQRLLQTEWKLKVRKHATFLLDERRFNKQCDLPAPEDVGKLAKFLIEKLNERKTKTIESPEDYRYLAMLTEARLLLYNRRRPGELEALTIETYKQRSTGVNETDLSLRSELTTLEKKLLKSQELVEIRGKGNKRVPVLLPEEVKVPLQLLTSKAVRDKSGVNVGNTYLFGSSGMEPIRAGAALDVIKFDANLQFPQRIYATNLRKHTATISQVMGLNDNELRWLVNHMGHTEKVHLQHYRATSGLIERLDIAKVMLMQEQGLVAKFAGVSLKDINFEDIDEPDLRETAAEAPELVPEDPCRSDQEVSEEEFAEEVDLPEKSRKKRSKAGSRVPWTVKEIEEINKYFTAYISLKSRKTCPGMKEILQMCAKSRASGGTIWKRQWEVIKKKVSYLVQKEKRK